MTFPSYSRSRVMRDLGTPPEMALSGYTVALRHAHGNVDANQGIVLF